MNSPKIKKGLKQIPLLLVFFGVLLGFSVLSLDISQAEEKDKSIATLTKFTGVVLVRKKLKWDPVEKVPISLYSGDKVVTQKGRATIDFRDGGKVDLGLDSNIKISEKKTSKGLIFRKQVKERTVKVSLGKVLFKVKKKKDVSNTLKTPTMVAAIRGSTAGFEVGASGSTKAIDIEGDMSFTGEFDSMQMFNAPKVDVPKEDLPESDPKLASTPLQQTARQASDNHVTAHNAMVAAQEKVKAAQKKVDQAASSEDKVSTGKELAQASAELAKTQNQVIGFFKSVVDEMKAETRQFKEADGESAASQQIENMQEQATQVASRAQAAQDNSDIAKLSNDPVVVLAWAESAKANWNTAKAFAQAGNVRAHLAAARGTGNSDAIDIAEDMVELSEKNIQLAHKGNKNIETALKLLNISVSEEGKQVALKTIMAHTHATKTAATANMTAGQVASSAVAEDIEGAEDSFDHAQKASDMAHQAAEMSDSLLKMATTASGSGDAKRVAASLAAVEMGMKATKAHSEAADAHTKAAKMVSLGGESEKIESAKQQAQDHSRKAKEAVDQARQLLDSMD